MGTWVMIRPRLISSISPPPQCRFWSNLVSTESYDQGESNGVGCKKFGGELAEDVGFYRGFNQPALIRNINAFYSWQCPSWLSFPYVKVSSSVLNRFQWDLEPFCDRNMGFVSIILWVWHVLCWKVCCKVGFYCRRCLLMDRSVFIMY